MYLFLDLYVMDRSETGGFDVRRKDSTEIIAHTDTWTEAEDFIAAEYGRNPEMRRAWYDQLVRDTGTGERS